MQNIYSQALKYHQSGLLAQAEVLYRQILEKFPENSDVLNALGMLLNHTGRFDESLVCLKKAATNAKNSAHIQLNLAEALRVNGSFQEADVAIRRALKLRPNYPEAWFCLGSLKHEEGNLAEAISLYRRCLNSKPDLFQASNAMGVAFQEQGNLKESVAILSEVLKKQPQYAEAYFNLGNTYLKLKNYFLAETQYLIFEKLIPNHPAVNLRLAEIELAREITDLEKVSKRLLKAELDFTDSPDFFAVKAQLLMQEGHLDEARSLLKRTIDLEPSPPLIMDYVRITKFKEADQWLINAVSKVDSSLAQDDYQNRSTLNFSLGKMYDDIRDYDQAIDLYNQGNAQMSELFCYDKEAEEDSFKEIKDFFNKDFFSRHNGFGTDSSKLIFITGMPRSGTTLLERVLTIDSRIKGAGELTKLFELQSSLPSTFSQKGRYPYLLDKLSIDQIRGVAETYLKEIEISFPGNYSKFVDKMPHNFLNIGLIATLFPKATIFNISRNKLDNCLSIYFEKFADGHAYSYNFDSLAHQYHLYENLMDHWRNVLPGKIVDVSYESLVEHSESEKTRLFKSMGLEADYFDKTDLVEDKNLVKTASIWQARQPIYKSSVNRSDNYKKYLLDLFDLLGEN